MRAKIIEARGYKFPQKEAGYTAAILSLSSAHKALAKKGETIYGLGGL
jgi:hypothetical protein